MNRALKELIRETQGAASCDQNLGMSAETIFVLGQLSNTNAPNSSNFQIQVEEEHKLYGDLLQLDFVGVYRNNTYKVAATLS